MQDGQVDFNIIQNVKFMCMVSEGIFIRFDVMSKKSVHNCLLFSNHISDFL